MREPLRCKWRCAGRRTRLTPPLRRVRLLLNARNMGHLRRLPPRRSTRPGRTLPNDCQAEQSRGLQSAEVLPPRPVSSHGRGPDAGRLPCALGGLARGMCSRFGVVGSLVLTGAANCCNQSHSILNKNVRPSGNLTMPLEIGRGDNCDAPVDYGAVVGRGVCIWRGQGRTAQMEFGETGACGRSWFNARSMA